MDSISNIPGFEFHGTKGSSSSSSKKANDKKGFRAFNIENSILKGINNKGFSFPTPIQRKAIPLIMNQRDVVAMARTGSGKTAAFVIPMLNFLKEHSTVVGARAIIIAPTRELVIQTFKVISELGKYMNLRICMLVGGERIEKHFALLANNPDIIVATPGRLLHIIDETHLSLQSVQYVVFDEADRLFEMGLNEQLSDILRKLPTMRQTILVSATLPSLLVEFVKVGLKNPEFVRLDADQKLSKDLRQSFFTVKSFEKDALLIYIINKFLDSIDSTIIFCATRHHCEYVYQLLKLMDIRSAVIYGSMDQTVRAENMTRFRSGKVQFLVVTDVAARGLDIPILDCVINYDFPAKPKLFVHRVGRVARAGRPGSAYSIVAFEDIPYMIDLHLFLGKPLKHLKVQKKKSEGEEDTDIVEEGNDNHEEEYELNESEDEYSGGGLPRTKHYLNKYDGIYGKVPQIIIDNEVEEVNRFLHDDIELKKQKEVCGRAAKLYNRTKGPPSKASIRRMKKLKMTVHPIFLKDFNERNGQKEMEKKVDFLEQIKSYKPTTTALEVNKGSHSAKIMEGRRKFHQNKKITMDKFNEEEYDESSMDVESETPKTLASKLLKNVEKSNKEKLLDLYKKKNENDRDGVMEDEVNNDDEIEEEDDSEESEEDGTNGKNDKKSNGTSKRSTSDESNEKKKKKKSRKRSVFGNSSSKSKAKTKSFKDSNFFMSYDPQTSTQDKSMKDRLDENDEIAQDNQYEREGYSINENSSTYNNPLLDAVMNLNGEDNQDMIKQRSVMAWDRKKKKYIQLKMFSGESVQIAKKRMNEAGVKITSKDNSELYRKWAGRTHARIQDVGEQEKNQDALISDDLPDTLKSQMNKKRNGSSSKIIGDDGTEEKEKGNKDDVPMSGRKRLSRDEKRQQKGQLVTKEQIKSRKKKLKKIRKTQQVNKAMKIFGKEKVVQRLVDEGMKRAERRRQGKFTHFVLPKEDRKRKK